jgi:hypothetical protein
MAGLPPIKRIIAEDFPDQKSWIAKLIWPLNQFMESVVSSLNKRLTFSENFAAQIKTFAVSGAQNMTRVGFQSTIGKPLAVFVAAVTDGGSPARVVRAPVHVDWSYSEGTIYINNVSGLALTVLGDTTSGSPTLNNVLCAELLSIGQTISGTGIAAGSVITAVSGSTITMDQNASATNAQQTLTFFGKNYVITVIAVAG